MPKLDEDKLKQIHECFAEEKNIEGEWQSEQHKRPFKRNGNELSISAKKRIVPRREKFHILSRIRREKKNARNNS